MVKLPQNIIILTNILDAIMSTASVSSLQAITKHLFAVGLTTLVLALPISVAAKKCADKNEKAALDLRAMQSQLMVAALSCNQHEAYNRYIKKFSRELSQQGRAFEHYFRRIYSQKAPYEMNRFITTLANASSKQSLRLNDEEFCQTSSYLFKELLTSDVKKIRYLAGDRQFEGLHGIGVCD